MKKVKRDICTCQFPRLLYYLAGEYDSDENSAYSASKESFDDYGSSRKTVLAPTKIAVGKDTSHSSTKSKWNWAVIKGR
jgi:hypothetical protein